MSFAYENPGDAFLSLYRFMEGWTFEQRAIALDEFVEAFNLENRNYWNHLASWWEVRDDDDVLLLSFAGMKGNEHLFDDHIIRHLFAEKAGLAIGSDASKVRTGLSWRSCRAKSAHTG